MISPFNLNTFFWKFLSCEFYTTNWVAAAAVVASSVLSDSAASRAARLERDTAEENLREQRRQFDVTQQQFEPYRETGYRGLEEYNRLTEESQQGNIPAQFKFGAEEFEQYKDPGYEFRVGEGLRALDRRLAAGGKRGAGVRPRALMDLGQQMGSQEFGAARGRALEDYSAATAREQSTYQRGYLDPLSIA